MIFHQAITEANRNGRLGLILYAIPNFPDIESFRKIWRILNDCSFVSIIETTLPVQTGFSPHANETIREAHRQSLHSSSPLCDLPSNKPTLCVLYQSTLDDQSFEVFASKAKDRFNGLILEWSESDESPYVEIANRYGLELTQCIGPWMTQERIRQIVSLCLPLPMVYLMSASMTGSKLFSNDKLTGCIRMGKQACPSMKIAAGFGIRGAEDIQRLHAVDGLDAVIIGTAFLEAMRQGPEEVLAFLNPLEEVLRF